MGAVGIRISIMKTMVILEDVGVVQSDAPFFIGLDILDKHQVVVDNANNVIACNSLN